MSHNDTLPAPGRHRAAAHDRRHSQHALVLGRYHLLEQLGAGGFGVVWSARDELLRRDVAVKRIPLPAGEDRARALREAQASARLDHPAIVALYEARAEDDAFYLISELVEGATLERLLVEGELHDDDLLEVGIALCDALTHAHARGVIHRDVKPQNVLLPDASREPSAGRGAIAKLTDFGGARLAGEEALTRTGDVLGTLAYMAPEQSEGREAGWEADLYSLALLLYESLSGVNPVRGPTPAATVRRIGRQLPPLRRYRGDLAPPLAHAVDRALSPRPHDRGTLNALREELTEALAPARASPHGPAGWLTAARAIWLAAAAALSVWQLAVGHAGVAVLAFAAVLPLVLLARHPGARWLAAGLAPALGPPGLAGAFPALAGQPARWHERGLLAALGYWWLTLAEPLWDGPARRLWLGPPSALATTPRVSWEGSLTASIAHVVFPAASLGLLLGGALWALAAIALPWLVRGRDAQRDALGAILWATGLAAATPPLLAAAARPGVAHAAQASPRGVILGSALGAVLAVLARALRGRAGRPV